MLKNNKNLKNKKKGFTLIELVIVIAVIAIISSIAIPKYGQIQDNAKRNADIANAKVIWEATTSVMAEEDYDDNVTDLELTKDNTVKLGKDESVGSAVYKNKIKVLTSLNDKLQTIPTPQFKVSNVKPDNFVLEIVNGAIEVTSGGKKVYPEAEEPFIKVTNTNTNTSTNTNTNTNTNTANTESDVK